MGTFLLEVRRRWGLFVVLQIFLQFLQMGENCLFMLDFELKFVIGLLRLCGMGESRGGDHEWLHFLGDNSMVLKGQSSSGGVEGIRGSRRCGLGKVLYCARASKRWTRGPRQYDVFVLGIESCDCSNLSPML